MPTPSRSKSLAAEFLSVEEASHRTGMHRDTLKKGIRAGQFPGYVIGNQTYLIPREWFERMMRGEWTQVPKERTVT